MTCSVAIASISSLVVTGGFFSINGLPENGIPNVNATSTLSVR